MAWRPSALTSWMTTPSGELPSGYRVPSGPTSSRVVVTAVAGVAVVTRAQPAPTSDQGMDPRGRSPGASAGEESGLAPTEVEGDRDGEGDDDQHGDREQPPPAVTRGPPRVLVQDLHEPVPQVVGTHGVGASLQRLGETLDGRGPVGGLAGPPE